MKEGGAIDDALCYKCVAFTGSLSNGNPFELAYLKSVFELQLLHGNTNLPEMMQTR